MRSRLATVVVALALLASCGGGGGHEAAPTSRPGTSAPRTTTSPTTSAPVPSASPTTGPRATSPPPTQETSPPPPATTVVPAGPAVVVRHGPVDRPVVALTFDAGSDTGFAAEILDILAAQGVRASFGITGVWAEANPALIRRMAAEGHQIINHTYDHPSFTGASTGKGPISAAQRIDQLDRGDAAIRRAGGPPTAPWFRPPYGDEDASVRADVARAGYRYEVMWSLDSLGWKGLSADAIAARCLDPSAARNGAIYLFHVGSQSADHAALVRTIAGLRADGFRFATVSGLLGV